MEIQIQPELLEAVKGTKVQDYDKLCEYATKCMQLIAGVDAEKLIKQFIKRETPKELEQRIALTQLINKSISKNLMDVAYKIPRSNAVAKTLTDEDSEKKNSKQLEKILQKFYGNKSFDDFCNDAFIDKNYIDTNGFIVFEWLPFDNNLTKAQPYPFIVSTSEAVYYQYINNILQFLVVKQVKKELETWTYYGKDFAQKLVQYLPGDVKPEIKEGEFKTDGEITTVVLDGKHFIFIQPTPYLLTGVPAFRIGFKKSLGNYNLLESPLDAAFPYLMKSIKTVSEMDLNMACHAFAQKFIYGPACTAKDCFNGRLPNNDECTVCKGTGVLTQTSAQDSIILKMPKTKDEQFDLSSLVYYEYPPVEGLTFQDAYIDKLTQKCERSVYGTETFTRKDVVQTATEKNLELQSKYDSLYPLACHYSDFWEWGINLICEITQIEGVIPVCTVGKDFKFKTKADYIQELKDAKDAGAGTIIIKTIENEIIKLEYADNPIMLKRHLVQDYFKPFQYKTEQERLTTISALPPDNYYKTLWTYFDEIFSSIELSNSDFYDLDIKKQKPVVDLMVNEFVNKNKVVQPKLNIPL